MDKDEARELNREAKIDKYESDMDKQCNSIRNILEDYFETTPKELLGIAEFLNRYPYLDLYNIDLSECENADDIIYELGYLR